MDHRRQRAPGRGVDDGGRRGRDRALGEGRERAGHPRGRGTEAEVASMTRTEPYPSIAASRFWAGFAGAYFSIAADRASSDTTPLARARAPSITVFTTGMVFAPRPWASAIREASTVARRAPGGRRKRVERWKEIQTEQKKNINERCLPEKDAARHCRCGCRRPQRCDRIRDFYGRYAE